MPLRECVKTATKVYIGLRKYALSKSEAKESVLITEKQEIEEAEEDSEVLQAMAEGYRSVASFITDLSLENRRKKEKGNCLVLTTIHSAKGLEWDNVFVMDCVEGILPSAAAEREGDIPEELRCFYVAITRARQNLYLLSPSYFRYNQMDRSRFIDHDNVKKTLDIIV